MEELFGRIPRLRLLYGFRVRFQEIFDTAKKLIHERTGLPAENILMAATHTHSAAAAVSIFQSEADKEYQDVPFEMIRTIEARVLWQSDEREWHFAASGSDVKEYSGKTYPARETSYAITLDDGTKVEGGVVAPLYVTTADGKSKTYVLHKRDKGDVGQKVEQLVYVKTVRFAD